MSKKIIIGFVALIIIALAATLYVRRSVAPTIPAGTDGVGATQETGALDDTKTTPDDIAADLSGVNNAAPDDLLADIDADISIVQEQK